MATSSAFAFPPANFLFLVESLLMQAQMQLGLLKLGDDDAEGAGPNLPVARHTIDLLAVLQEKTRGNLTVEEQRLLENGLTELRFRYVQVSEELAKTGASDDGTPEKTDDRRIITPDDDAPRIITPGDKGFRTA